MLVLMGWISVTADVFFLFQTKRQHQHFHWESGGFKCYKIKFKQWPAGDMEKHGFTENLGCVCDVNVNTESGRETYVGETSCHEA